MTYTMDTATGRRLQIHEALLDIYRAAGLEDDELIDRHLCAAADSLETAEALMKARDAERQES